MDHLPKPRNGHPKVHFYGTRDTKYQPGDFFTIPTREPWRYGDYEDLLENGLRDDMTDADANTFLLSWLFFALLAQVLNREIDSSDFYKHDQTLSTKKLNCFLEEWLRRENNDAESSHSRNITQYIRTSIAIDNARRFISKHCSYDRMDRDDPNQLYDEAETLRPRNRLDSRLDTKLTLAIAILGETLQRERPALKSDLVDQTLLWEYHKTASDLVGQVCRFFSDSADEERDWGYSVFARNQMKEKKWCNFEIRRIESTFSQVSIIYVMSQMPHLLPLDRKNHENCTMRKCTAESANPRLRTALHLGGCEVEGCETYGEDDTRLAKWIEEGKTPLVTWTDEKGIEFEAFDLKADKVVFGALTHGWEDGLLWSGTDARGKNNRRMHRCQIERAQETFEMVLKTKLRPGDRLYFWVDVLCLPRYARIRGEAINQMKVIYREAGAVIIWDRKLLQSRKFTSMIETNMRLRVTNWSKRLWTLQEAVLAEDLYIEFQDGVVSTEHIRSERDLARHNIDHEYHHIWKAGHPFHRATWKLRTKLVDRVPRAWTAVQFLTVSESSDETFVLANILGLDVTKLKEINGATDNILAARRMVKFLDMLDKAKGLGIPSGIIFVPGPKLLMEGVEETRGFGWAPRTWLSRQAYSYPPMRSLRRAGSIMSHGLLVEFPGIVIDCAGAPPESEVFWIPVDQGMHKWVKVVVDHAGKAEDWSDFWLNKVCTKSELSIIMCTDRPTERWEVGVLAQTKGHLTQGEIKWVKIICRVWVRRETNTNVIREKTDTFRRATGPLLFGIRYLLQKWCVDGDED